MIGLIQKVLCDVVEARKGPEAVKAMLVSAGIPPDRQFRIHEDYPQEETSRLIAAAPAALGVSAGELMDIYADDFIKLALKMFPRWFQMAKNSREFIEIQPTIHNTFSSSVADPVQKKAVNDKHRIERRGDTIVTAYRSPHRLCALYRSLAHRVARHYGDRIEIEETRCMHRGDDACEMHLRWLSMGNPGA